MVKIKNKKRKEALKKWVVSFLSLLVFLGNTPSTYASQFARESAISTNLQLQQKDAGALPVKQLDLGTGNVTLQESLLAVEGYHASIAYNSEGVAQKAITWNRSQKQGTLGLGWEYPENRIIRLTQQTGTTEDDKYLLYNEGASYPLLFIDQNATEKTYRIAKKHDWVVKYHIAHKQWRLFKGSGQIYIYGDGALIKHQANSLEHNVKWGNWIGSTNIQAKQKLLPISYNVSAIEDIYGEQVKFFYKTTEENVGSLTGKKHTRASYLTKVEGLRGKTLHFTYQKKDNFEYSDPHTENGKSGADNDLDAYQERYEDQFLKSITLKNRKEQQIKKIDFEFKELKKDTELQKRVLSSINYLDAKNAVYKPAKTFDYFGLNDSDGVNAGFTKAQTKMYNATNGALYGAIKQENLPEGVSYAYQYGKEEIQGASKTLAITFPKNPKNTKYNVTSRWSAPELFYGNDYVVAIFESQDLLQRQSHVKVYQWIGDRWTEQDLGIYDGYFYDRYFAKDQYTKSILKKAKEALFNGLGKIPGGAPLIGVINAVTDGIKDEVKTLYKVGDDLNKGKVGKAIDDWFKGEANVLKDIALDIAAGFEKEIEQLKKFVDRVFGPKELIFKDNQEDMYEARQKDASLNPRKQYHIVLQNDFFALTTSLGGIELSIFQKNKLVPGTWTPSSKRTNLTSKFFSFDAGENFIAVLDEITDFLYIYSWDGLVWNTEMTILKTDFNKTILNTSGKNNLEDSLNKVFSSTGENTENKLDHRSSIVAKNNMLLAVITDSHGTNADITIFHHDENMHWKNNSTQINKKAVAGNVINLSSLHAPQFSLLMGKDGKIDLKLGNSFAVLQTYDNLNENIPSVGDIPLIGNLIEGFTPDTKKINSTYGIIWDENFENIQLTHLHSAAGQSGVESFIVGDVINKIGKAHSLLVGTTGDNGKNYAFRYNGKQFSRDQFTSPYYTSGFANDVVSTITESSNKAYKTPEFYQYNPNTASWSIISNASKEQIAAPDFIDEAINVTVEVINIIVQVVTLVVPGLGEALEVAEETIQTIDNAANIVQNSTMVMEPVAKELVKDIMGTNHKSTSIANNYISVNGKLFHRNPTGTWSRVSNDLFNYQGNNPKLVGSTNNVVSNFIPYTIKTDNGIENHIKLLGNGQVYDTELKSASNFTVHQDSISSTIGASAYVSYGPVSNNGFVQKNAYTAQFKPTIGATADERARRNRPAYKDATKVLLHKVTGLDLDNHLYDYPVKKVTIKENTTELSAHHYVYDTTSAAYDSSSHITLYGKVIDIPSSKGAAFNTSIDLTSTDGGYIEHYFYNRYNTYGASNQNGYPSNASTLKLKDSKLITYQSIHNDDTQNYKNGNITTMYGHPYATLIYNTNKEIVSYDHTYYNVWEEDLRHTENGNSLEENRIYVSRPVKKIHSLDNVQYVTKMAYDFAKHSLVLRKNTTEGILDNLGNTEAQHTYHTYAFEHYDALRKVNRLQEPFGTISTVKQQNDSEKITKGDIIGYETFKVNGEDRFAPKNFYKLANNNNKSITKTIPENIVALITSNIIAQATIVGQYNSTFSNAYNGIKKDFNRLTRAKLSLQKKHNEIQGSLEELHTDLFAMETNLGYYKNAIIIDKKLLTRIDTNISLLNKDRTKNDKEIIQIRKFISSLHLELTKVITKIDDFFGGIFGGKSEADFLREDIATAQIRINQLNKIQKQILKDIQKESENKNKLIAENHKLKKDVTTLDQALKEAKNSYSSFNKAKTDHIININSNGLNNLSDFQFKNHISVNNTYTLYNSEEVKNLAALNTLHAKLNLPTNNLVKHPNYDATFLQKMKAKVVEISVKNNEISNLFTTLHGHHVDQIINGFRAEEIFKTISKNYAVNWIRNKTIDQRDKTSGIPISWYDTQEKYQSVVLHPDNKKPTLSITGINIHDANKKQGIYHDFELIKGKKLIRTSSIHSIIEQGHTGNHSIKTEHPKIILDPNIGKDNNNSTYNNDARYIVSAWIKVSNGSQNGKLILNQNHKEIGKTFHVTEKEGWKYIDFIASRKGSPKYSIDLGTRGSILIDNLLIRPLGTLAKTKTWDDNDNLIDEIANNGLHITHIYDDAQQHIASIDNTGKMMDYTHHGYSKLHNKGVYTENAPNKNFNIHFQGKTQYFKTSSNTTIATSDLGNRFAISFTSEHPFKLTKGSHFIERNGKSISFYGDDVSEHKNFLLITQNDKLVLYDGAKEISQIPNTDGDLQIQGNLRNLIIGKEPVVAVSYKDGLARNIQQQYWYNTENQITGKIVNGTTYNGWGKPIIHTKPIHVAKTNLDFQDGFINYNFATGEMNGSFNTLFTASNQINTKDYKISGTLNTKLLYHETVYSNDPLQRVLTTTKPGLNNQDNNNTQRTEYKGLNGTNLITKLGITNGKQNLITSSSKINRNNITTSSKDVLGRVTANIIGKTNDNKSSITSTIYGYDVNGNSFTEKRLPLSHHNDAPSTYKNKHVNKDLLGDRFFTNTVDENTKYIIKNKKGLPVFSSTNNFDATKTNIKWNYIQYDAIDRPIESGIIAVPGAFNENQMNLLANVPVFFNNLNKNTQQQWKYDNIETKVHNPYSLGKIVRSIRSINQQAIEHKYTYNQRGQITSKATHIDGIDEGTITYSYFNDGKVKSITYPNNTQVLYTYDLNGRLYGVGTPTNSMFYAKYSYGPNGKINKSIMCLDLLTSTQKYTLQEHKAESKVILRGKTTPFFEETLKYTNSTGSYFNGMLISKKETQEGQPTRDFTYGYDNQYRLKNTAVNTMGSNSAQNYNYTYDVNGNIKSYISTPFNRDVSFSLENGTNKRVSASDKVNNIGLYTSIGSTPLGNTTQLQYDAFTRKVVSIGQGNTTEKPQVTFSYDNENKRIQKTRNYTTAGGIKVDDKLTYLFGNRSLPLFEKLENKITRITSDKVYVYGAGYAPIAMLHKGEAYYFVNDYQNSLRNLVQAKGQRIVETYQYTPYGEISYSNSQAVQAINNLGTYLYTGQEYDVETGLYNFKARLYSPEKKIFLQPDPKHINYSPYTYANDNPANFVDIDGKAPLWILDHVEEPHMFEKVRKEGGIAISHKDLLKESNLPNLDAAGFDGTINFTAHGAAETSSKYFTGGFIGKNFGNDVSKISTSLGNYTKSSAVAELDLNLAVCYAGSTKPNGKSFISNFGQSLSDSSLKNVNAAGFKGSVAYGNSENNLNSTFISYHPTDAKSMNNTYQHLDPRAPGSNSAARSLNRSLNYSEAYKESDSYFLHADIKNRLGPYGVSKNFTPKLK